MYIINVSFPDLFLPANNESFKIKCFLPALDKFNKALKTPLSKWLEPRSISSSFSVIVRVRVVLRRTVVGD